MLLKVELGLEQNIVNCERTLRNNNKDVNLIDKQICANGGPGKVSWLKFQLFFKLIAIFCRTLVEVIFNCNF